MDESQNALSRQTPIFRDKPLFIAIALLFLASAFFWVAPFGGVYFLRNVYLVIGGFFVKDAANGSGVAFLVIFGLLWVLTATLLITEAKNRRSKLITCALLGLTTIIIALGLVVGTLLVIGVHPLASTTFAGHRYHFEHHASFSDGNSEYALIRCNQLDLACQTVQRFVPKFSPDRAIALISDENTKTLAIVVDGETLYTYTPQ